MTQPPTRPLTLLLALALAPSPAHAKARSFDVGYGGRNIVRFTSAALLETIEGRTGAVSGTFQVDPAHAAGAASGRVEVDLTKLVTGIDKRDKDMRGPQYLDTDRHPRAAFVLESVRAKPADLSGDEPVPVTLEGVFHLHGVAQKVKIAGTARYVERTREMEPLAKAGIVGDVLHFQGGFDIKLTDYDIKRPQFLAFKIADEVRVSLDVFAFAKPLAAKKKR